MKKKSQKEPWQAYVETLPLPDQEKLAEYWAQFASHCRLSSREKKTMREDIERAFLYYAKAGLDLDQALALLDTKFLGGFYARPPVLWFHLDDAAKIYPLSMERGRMAVFRLSVTLKEKVVPELLQMALTFTMKRFPSFATTLKKGVFWHYLDTTKRRFSVEQEKDIPCQPLKVSHSGSQSFRALYWENRISVEFFHVLTDGSGGLIFLKTLVAEYLRLRGVEIPPTDTLWDINAAFSPEELENAFAKVPVGKIASGFMDKAALQMTGKLSQHKPCRILHMKMDAEQLKKAAEKYQATVTQYLLGLMFLAEKGATDEWQGDANIQVPVNMRKFYPSKTVRNFSLYCGIRLPIGEITDLAGILPSIREQMGKKAAAEAMAEMLTATEKLVRMLKYIPLVVKEPVAKLVYGFLGDQIFSNTLSNLGVVELPRVMAEQIQDMDFVLGTAITNRVSCALLTVNQRAVLSVSKQTVDPSFEEQLYALLSAEGIDVQVEGSPLYED